MYVYILVSLDKKKRLRVILDHLMPQWMIEAYKREGFEIDSTW